MTQRKQRKATKIELDPAEEAFLKGQSVTIPEPKDEPEPELEEEETEDEPEPVPTPSKTAKKPRKQSQQPTGSFMSQIASQTVEKEPTVRITVDLPESLHQKLSVFCAKTRTKKADIIRGLLIESLQQFDE